MVDAIIRDQALPSIMGSLTIEGQTKLKEFQEYNILTLHAAAKEYQKGSLTLGKFAILNKEIKQRELNLDKYKLNK